MSDLFAQAYNPDVLSCLANLSNDEVFTPPEVANQMLDMLPEEIWSDPNVTFLDPASKSGVFLREIAKRLIDGLEDEIPDLEERLEHIFKKQLFGIATTELCSLLSRRSLYCSKYPNYEYSVVKFDDAEGNIRYRKHEHDWRAGKCTFCGASQKEYEREDDLESYAYEFIHLDDPEKALPMKFDVIVGNPPYQLSDGGSKASAKPIYNLFVEQAKKLNPRFLTMIIPARWFSGGKGLDEFRSSMLSDNHVTQLVDYFDSTECFPGVDISGGVCYFLWTRDEESDCEFTSIREGKSSTRIRPLLDPAADNNFIRFNEAISIVSKVTALHEPKFNTRISSRKPFGITTDAPINSRASGSSVKIYAYPNNGFISKSAITKNEEYVNKFKVLISYAYGERGAFPYLVIGKPFVGEPSTCCTETYLVVGTYDDEATAKNVISYMTTKFFRFLVLQRKNTQHATKTVYDLVPDQDFSKPWTDEELYEKYGITEEEQAFIDSMIRPMELDDAN